MLAPWGQFTKCGKNMHRTICTKNVKVKYTVNFNLEQAMKAQIGSRGLALLFLQPRR